MQSYGLGISSKSNTLYFFYTYINLFTCIIHLGTYLYDTFVGVIIYPQGYNEIINKKVSFLTRPTLTTFQITHNTYAKKIFALA